MRKLLTILIFASFSLQLFTGNILMLSFAVDNASFLKYCENISRPVLQCEGKCQLLKKIAEAEDKQQQNPEAFYEIKLDFAALQYRIESPEFAEPRLLHGDRYVNTSLCEGNITEIFQPPADC